MVDLARIDRMARAADLGCTRAECEGPGVA
jgi:hypothetical protein